jgi:hypothetical protein
MIGSPTIDREHAIAPTAWTGQRPAAPFDHPGRWLGGAAGALASLIAAIVLNAFGPARGDSFVDLREIALLGVPIGFVLGRALYPSARDETWTVTLSVGLLLGWLAPPLGAIEILAGPALLPPAWTGGGDGWRYLWLLPIAIPVSYVAVFITMPVGVLWSALVKLIPPDLPKRLRMPRPIERLGVRHAVLTLLAWSVVVQLLARPVL